MDPARQLGQDSFVWGWNSAWPAKPARGSRRISPLGDWARPPLGPREPAADDAESENLAARSGHGRLARPDHQRKRTAPASPAMHVPKGGGALFGALRPAG